MMKRTVWLWSLFGFAVTSLGGTVLHFLYDWFDTAWIAPFSGVNESTWEHIKLLFWPMLGYAIAESLFFRGYKSFWCIKLKGILLGCLMIPLIFYMYNGVIGKSPDFVNISIFFVAAAITYVYETRALKRDSGECNSKTLAIGTLFVMAFLFVVFTFDTPRIAIFKDPITGKYGI